MYPYKLLSGGIGQTTLWCNFHDHHQRAGLPSDTFPHCIQELVSLACFVATRENIAEVQKGALSFLARSFYNIQMENIFV